MIKGSFSLNVIALNNLLIKIASFAVCDKANNSASVLDVVTVSCLFALQAIGPPNSFIMYPCELFTELSANDASLAQINDCASLGRDIGRTSRSVSGTEASDGSIGDR